MNASIAEADGMPRFPMPTVARREAALEPSVVAEQETPAIAAVADAPREAEAEQAFQLDTTHWTARLLASHDDDAPGGIGVEARRLATGLGLAAIYGLAAGARQGGLAFAKSALLVPAALLAACAFGLPALYIALGMVDAPLAPRRLFAAASRATAGAGLVLAGLAPVAALYVVSSGSRDGAEIATAAGLLVGSLAGVRLLCRDIAAEVREGGHTVKAVTVATLFGFAVFAAAVGSRVWMHLPVFVAGAK